MSYLDAFKEKISQNDYPGFLKLWEEYAFSEKIDPEELLDLLLLVKNSSLAKPFGSHVQRAISLWREIKDLDFSYKILKAIVDIQNTNDLELADLVYNYLKERYADDKLFETKIRLVGLRTKENFQRAISGYELLSHIKAGKFVYHTAGWGVGEVIDYSLVREELTIEFEFLQEKKTLSFENALKNLLPLADESFLARRFGNPDDLEKEAKENPLAIMHLLLKELGPQTAQEIKDNLFELVIPANDWNKWWQTARQKMKRDESISCPEESDAPYILRKKAITHEDSFINNLKTKKEPKEIIDTIYNFERDFSDAAKKEEVKEAIRLKLDELLNGPLSESEKLSIEFLKEDLFKNSSANDIIKNSPSIEKLIQETDILNFKKRILINLKKINSSYEEIFLSLFLVVDHNFLRDYILQEVKSEKINHKIDELIKNPTLFPTAFIWYFKKLTSEKEPIYGCDKKTLFLEGFLILINFLLTSQPDTAKKMVSLLISDRFKIIRDIFKEASLAEVKEFLLLASKCRAFNDCDVKIIYSLAEVVHPELKQKEEAEEEIIWSTEEGYKKARDRLRQISTVEMLENAKEIEEARAHGDLRENAEYKSALERRARLQGEMKFISSQFEKVRILTPNDVSTDMVGVGSIVTCKNKKGETTTFSILGPWDADVEKNIMSYNSKLAQTMKDKKVGDSFKFKEDEFTIKSISSYFK